MPATNPNVRISVPKVKRLPVSAHPNGLNCLRSKSPSLTISYGMNPYQWFSNHTKERKHYKFKLISVEMCAV